MRTTRVKVALRVLVTASVAGVLMAPAAAGHVTVNPREAEKGSYTRVAFRVPTERDDASTTEVEINLPAEEHPIRSVSVQPKPGWEYEVETIEVDAAEIEAGEGDSGEEDTYDIVSKITWTGGEVAPGEFVEFDVSMGRLPEDADELVFPAIQTYEGDEGDGDEVVEWIETGEGEDVERPAPTLTLVDAEEGEHGAEGGEDEEAGGGVTVENVASQSDVDSANRFAIIGILVGLAGVATGAFSLVKGRRQA